jgi:hypothetical protein
MKIALGEVTVVTPNNAFERSVNRHRVRAASAARHHASPARSRARRAAAQRER